MGEFVILTQHVTVHKCPKITSKICFSCNSCTVMLLAFDCRHATEKNNHVSILLFTASQCLKYGGITTQMGSDQLQLGSDKLNFGQ